MPNLPSPAPSADSSFLFHPQITQIDADENQQQRHTKDLPSVLPLMV